MSTAPAYASTVEVGIGQVSVANTNRDGTGTTVTIVTAGASGTRIDWIRIVSTVATTAGMVRLFVDNGVNTRMVAEIDVLAQTPSATVKGYTDDVTFERGILLESGMTLKASTHNAEAINVFAFGGHF